MVEVLISLVISGFVTSMVVYMLYQSALTSKDMYGETRTRSTRMGALDQIRYRLVEAEIGTVDITNAARRIRFIDPNPDATSEFFFVPETYTLFYDDDIDDGTAAVEIINGPIDLTFEHDLGDPNSGIIILNVRTATPIGFGDVDTQDGETVVYLRNV